MGESASTFTRSAKLRVAVASQPPSPSFGKKKKDDLLEIPIFVYPKLVPRFKPSIDESFSRRLLIIPVPQGDVTPLEPQITNLVWAGERPVGCSVVFENDASFHPWRQGT